MSPCKKHLTCLQHLLLIRCQIYMKPPGLYKLILCIHHNPIYNYSFNLMFLRVHIILFQILASLLPFLTLSFTTFNPISPPHSTRRLSLKRILLCILPYHIIPCICLNRILSCVQLSFLMSILSYKSFSCTITLLTMWFTLDNQIQLKFFLYAFVLLRLPLLHPASMTILLEDSLITPLCVLELYPKVIPLTFSLHLTISLMTI